jgi:hypothetical protein
MEVACRDHHDGPGRQSRHQEPEQQIMREMVHSKSGLCPVLGALMDIAELCAGIEYEPVYACLAQPFFNRSRETPHAREPREIERERFNPGRRSTTRTDHEPNARNSLNLP